MIQFLKVFGLAGVALGLFNPYSYASPISYAGAVTTGTAGAGRAAIEPTEAPILNSAAVSFMRGYFFSSTYTSLQNGERTSVSLVDNLPDSAVPTALSYAELNGKTSLNQDLLTHDLRLSVGNFMSEKLSVGFGFHHKVDELFMTSYTQLNMQIGTLWIATPDLGFALIADNIISPDTKVPLDYRLSPATSLGLNYNYLKFMRVKLDVESANNNSFDQPAISSGIETYWNPWFIFRVGARKDLATNVDQFGVGFGFVGPQFAVHYAYLSSPQQENLNRQAVDLAIPIW